MNWRAFLAGAIGLGCMVAAGAVLFRVKSTQELGAPGLKSTPIPGTDRVQIDLPERVLNFTSKEISLSEVETNSLPADTSFARRLYEAGDGFKLVLGVVMMGTDRTSIHKPEFCLTSQGWRIVKRETVSIALDDPPGYQLPVRKFTASFVGADPAGRIVRGSGVYVFWFVADQRVAAEHIDRIKQMTWDLLRTGVLPRWAYVSCFATCQPGAEEATYERMKAFLAAAVPKFQTAFPTRHNGPRLAITSTATAPSRRTGIATEQSHREIGVR